jgi:hypothetical protein
VVVLDVVEPVLKAQGMYGIANATFELTDAYNIDRISPYICDVSDRSAVMKVALRVCQEVPATSKSRLAFGNNLIQSGWRTNDHRE